MCNLQNCSALLSRCKVIVLEKLSSDSIYEILRRAAKERHFVVSGNDAEENEAPNAIKLGIIEYGALKYLSGISDGDARMALNCLQVMKSNFYSVKNLFQRLFHLQTALDSAPEMKNGERKGIVKLEDVKAALDILG